MAKSSYNRKRARAAAAAAAAKRKTTKQKITNHGAYAGFKNESIWTRGKVTGKRKSRHSSFYVPAEVRIRPPSKLAKNHDQEQNDLRDRAWSMLQEDATRDEEQAIVAALRAKTDSVSARWSPPRRLLTPLL